MNLYSDTDLADMLGITVENVRRGTREKGWPCVKPRRNVWRFTEAQVEQIVGMASKSKARRKSSGQTARSRGRGAA